MYISHGNKKIICMAMAVKVLIVFSLFVAGYSKIVNYTDCGNVTGSLRSSNPSRKTYNYWRRNLCPWSFYLGSIGAKVNSVDITPCEAEPCVLHRGTNCTINVNFTAFENSSGAKTIIQGILPGVPLPLPWPSDSCINHNLNCPVTSGVTDMYSNYVYVYRDYPKIRLPVKWEVQDDNGKDIFCLIVPLSIGD